MIIESLAHTLKEVRRKRRKRRRKAVPGSIMWYMNYNLSDSGGVEGGGGDGGGGG